MEDTLVILATLSPAFAAAAGFFAAAWWSGHRHLRRLESILRERSELGRRGDGDTLEQALAAIEDQLDRVREDQEFLTRMVADAKPKPAVPAPSDSERDATPR